ncbi:MAG: hypothetical protein A3B11_01250 [Candidatus Taylorbacteria bacterium RIFCSPLOWO2_01_FULL_44_26]|uniref:Four helix bundle protein n=2 Tax=Candidatus Tayloriibacteriota TaxID=1817919 RepID=A0A1G2MJT3_9BACT|nr:MAG: hypothetical protein A3D50_01030 [Candidatus Taylorbacteria bacterium RIFCSPHIGHO2_02_FULL_44_12]OHA30943.1 MAG: hypothetical protein A3B11_01250 [Candidatus Taylorbacteria bacterium RIFCSPLOWO2_01_FULL_44_26]
MEKVQKDNKKFKVDFKIRLYGWSLRVIKMIDTLSKGQSNLVIGNQLLRSSTSILANYVEGQSASSRKDFTNFVNHSLKSANESKVWLSFLRDLKKGDNEELEWLIKELIEISNILASIIMTLRNKKIK